MPTVFLTSQIFILLFTFAPLAQADVQANVDSRIASAHFEVVAEQLKEGMGTQDFVDSLKMRFKTQEDARWLDDLAKRTPRISVTSAQASETGLVLTTENEKKIEMKAEKSRLMLNGRSIDIPANLSASQFFARVDSILQASRISRADLLLPRAHAVSPLHLLAGAVVVYAGSEIYSALVPYTLDTYLEDLTQTCERERKQKREFEGSKTAITLDKMAQKHLFDAKTVNPKVGCEASVQKMLEVSQKERVREGELKKTCVASQKFVECVRLFKHEARGDHHGGPQKKLSR